jgi:Domain of unknown function (DUF5668)/Putative adhesin
MASNRPRSSGIFGGLVLISVGVLLLIRNYHGLDLWHLLGHWWPLLLIFLGLIKLYERTVGQNSSEPGAARITGGEIWLLVAMVAIVASVAGIDIGKKKFENFVPNGESFPFPIDLAPKTVPANAHISIHTGRGDINVRSSTDSEIRVSAKKNIRAWSEEEAQRTGARVSAEIVQNGDAYEVRPTGFDQGDSRLGVDFEVSVPGKAVVTLRTEKGDIVVADMNTDVSVTDQNGDVDIRDTTGGVSIELHKGDIKVSDTKGDIKITGKGGAIEAEGATGSLTVDGDFYGPIRADKIAKGLRVVSPKTDLTLSQLTGHMEASSGNVEILDAPGNLTLRTRDNNINVENAGGKVKIDNRDASTEMRFAVSPKDDIEITNSSGEISLSLPGSASFEIQADCRSCDIESEFSADTLKQTKSGSSDSHLEGKYGSGRGPKITLKTSYGAISLHRTSSVSPPEPPPVPKLAFPPKKPATPTV